MREISGIIIVLICEQDVTCLYDITPSMNDVFCRDWENYVLHVY